MGKVNMNIDVNNTIMDIFTQWYRQNTALCCLRKFSSHLYLSLSTDPSPIRLYMHIRLVSVQSDILSKFSFYRCFYFFNLLFSSKIRNSSIMVSLFLFSNYKFFQLLLGIPFLRLVVYIVAR